MPPIFGDQGFFSHMRQQLQDPFIRYGTYGAVSMYGCMTAINSIEAGESPTSSIALLIAGTAAGVIDMAFEAYHACHRQQANQQMQAKIGSVIEAGVDAKKPATAPAA